MKYLKNTIKISLLATILLAAQLIAPIPKQADQALAAQNCSLNSFYGTVTYNGVAADGATVTLTDLTNGAPALTTTTSNGGLYLIESGNLTVCASVGDQMQLTASFSGSSASITTAYVLQSTTLNNLAITSTLSSAKNITAFNFATPAATGVITGTNIAITVPNGTAVTALVPAITISANATVNPLSGVAQNFANPVIYTVTAQDGSTQTYTATVTIAPPATYTITSSAGANGAISPLGATTVNSGADQAYSITPSAGYNISDVLVDSVSQGAISAYTFTNVAANHTISASFAAVPVLTTINVMPNPASIVVGANQQFTATTLDQYGAPIAATVTWTSNDTAVATINSTSGLATGVAAGGPITITATSGTVSGTANLTITPIALTITANPQTKIYGEADPALTYTITSGALLTGDTITGSLDRVAGVNVGTYAINQGTLTAGVNYAITFVSADLTIMASPITVTAATDTKIYDDSNSSTGVPTITSGTLATGDTATWTQTFDNKNVGTGKMLNPAGIVNDGNNGNNYIVTFVADTTGVITGKVLTITANNANKTFGTTLTFSGLEFTTSGLIGNDNVSGVTLTSDGAASGAATSTYPIIASLAVGTGLSNYDITYVNGTLTVYDLIDPVITWANPADIAYLTPLSATQLNATSSVPGTFIYTPDVGTVLNVGNGQILSTLFTPTATTTYNSISANALINVLAPTYAASSTDLTSLVASGSLAPASGSVSTSTPSLTTTADVTISIPDEDNTSQIILPYGTIISSIDGSLINADSLTAIDATSNTFVGLGSGVVVNAALQWGITNLGLQFSSPITLKIFVSNSLNGQTLNVYRSVSGNDGWTADGIVSPATCIVTNGFCNFQATKASYYVAATPAPVSAPVSSGGGGGGGGSVSYITQSPQSQTAVTTVNSTEIQNQINRQLQIEKEFKNNALINQGQVLGIKTYSDGSLIRGADKRIYFIVNGMKLPIKTLAELKKYKGQKIYDVSNDVLNAYPTISALPIYTNGQLIRGTDKKIYVIVNGKKQQIRNLNELKKYKGQKIHNVSNDILSSYPNSN